MKAKTKTTRRRVYPILQQIVQYLPEWTLEKLANKHRVDARSFSVTRQRGPLKYEVKESREASGDVISDEVIVLTGDETREKYTKFLSAWTQSFARLVGIVRGGMWLEIDLVETLILYGTEEVSKDKKKGRRKRQTLNFKHAFQKIRNETE